MKLKGILAALLLTLPTAALAAPGIVSVSASMRAGPGPRFPMVDRIPAGAHVDIHGCLRGDAWCDVGWSGDRGWVSSQYLEYLYRDRYVYLPDYVDVIDVPVVPFVLDTYWATYYSGRPWYHRRAYWSSYWQSHARFAVHAPATRFDSTQTRTGVSSTQTRTGAVQGATTRQQSFANVRSAQGRMAHVNGAARTLSGTHQTIGTARTATRFSRAPTAGATNARIAQPNAGRISGSPLNAHAQMGAPHTVGANLGGAPHINTSPHTGGGGAAGGPAAHQRH